MDAVLQLIITSSHVDEQPAIFLTHINLWSLFHGMTFANEAKVLSTTQIVSDEKVDSFVMPITDSNCYVMKLMFCRIYNLILMVFPFHPLSHFYSISPHLCCNNGNRIICEGSLILFSSKFFSFSLPSS